MKRILFCLIFIFYSKINAQPISPDSLAASPNPPHLYHINPWITGSVIAGGAAIDLLALNWVRFKPSITSAEFASLRTDDINPFDRWALHQSTVNYAGIETYATIVNAASVLLPVTLFLDSRIGHDWSTVLAMYLEVESISLSIYMASPLGPLFQNKFRPIVYYDNLTQAERSNGNNRNSFYSGHTASAAAATFFMAKVYSDYHPEIGADKYLLYTAAAIPPLVLGYIRMRGLNHFPSDILTGFGIGGACGILIPELHRFKMKNVSFGIYSSPFGGSGITTTYALN